MSLRPLSPDEWTLETAQHLLNRAAFGGTREQAQELMFSGRAKSVELLIAGLVPSGGPDFVNEKPLVADELERPAESPGETDSRPDPRAERRRLATERAQRLHTIQLPWLRRMHTSNAAREKLTLFWHGMVTSGFTKVDNRTLMLAQNARLRSLSTGDYRVLISELCVDPAMIHYLDIDQNRRTKPNENFARELLELFTLGEGNYDDTDIKRLARVFVNLKVDEFPDDMILDAENLPSISQSAGFSDRMKAIRKEIGRIFAKPVCGELLCRRLLRFYLTDEPETRLVKDLNQVLRANQWQVGPTLSVLFSSQLFYSNEFRGLQIKSPVQFLMKAMIDLKINMVPEIPAEFAMSELGQALFNPPNVAGWPGGRTWINSSSLAKRYELMAQLIEVALTEKKGSISEDLAALRLIPKSTIDSLIDQWFPHQLPLEKRRLFETLSQSYLESPKKLLLALAQSPEYQLC